VLLYHRNKAQTVDSSCPCCTNTMSMVAASLMSTSWICIWRCKRNRT